MTMAATEELSELTKRSSVSQLEHRPAKITKRIKDKKRAKSFDVDKVVEALSDSTDKTSPDSKEKKPQGIVIDGKTYTCATCKTGHRVGVCKHAKERPMTATHPPGRPPAGAPKKVICDCPKQCKCKKKDCKCARNCNCMQVMYMLVYVPAPGEVGNMVDGDGSWKIGNEVTTDLKGNVLTADQIKIRQEQKEAQKNGNAISITTPNSVSTLSPSEAKPAEQGGCCKHKEVVANQNIAAEASPESGQIVKTASGCNCGHTCNCAFCPEHPNNQRSMDVARQQAMFFANQSQMGDRLIQPFISDMPQNVSCMGGMPRFAISRYSSQPSFEEMQQAFPNPGYVIGYPVWTERLGVDGLSIPPFPVQRQYIPDLTMMNQGSMPIISPQQMIHTPVTPQPEISPLQFSQDEFGIGNAFVASAGSGGFNFNTLISPDIWSMDGSIPNGTMSFQNPPNILNSTRPSNPTTTGFVFYDNQNVEDEFLDVPPTDNEVSLDPSGASTVSYVNPGELGEKGMNVSGEYYSTAPNLSTRPAQPDG